MIAKLLKDYRYLGWAIAAILSLILLHEGTGISQWLLILPVVAVIGVLISVAGRLSK